MALTVGVNSYATNAEADTYFTDSLRAAEWVALGEPTQDAALVEATRYLERFDYVGEKTDVAPTQTLKWPRTGVVDSDGEALSSSVIPDEIKEAQYETAIRLAADPTLIDNINQQGSSNIKRAKADTAEVEFFAPIEGGRLFDWVQTLIGHFLTSGNLTGGIGGATAVGNEDESFFETGSEKYGRTRGYD